MGITVFVYGVRQLTVMTGRTQVSINSYLNFGKGAEESMKGYGVKQNINFAFGITDFSLEEL